MGAGVFLEWAYWEGVSSVEPCSGDTCVCPSESFERTFWPVLWPHKTTVPMRRTKRTMLRSPTPMEAKKSFFRSVIFMSFAGRGRIDVGPFLQGTPEQRPCHRSADPL